MLIKQKLGNVEDIQIADRVVDILFIEWYEANKRILHKQTKRGQTINLKFLQQNPALADGDILYMDDANIVVVELKPCQSIVIKPSTIPEASAICYEIGNKHLPLFHEGDDLLIPFDAPLYRLLQASGYSMVVEERKLSNPIKTSVLPHAHAGNSTSLFNKILQLTTPANG